MNSKQKPHFITGFTLVEVLVAATILVIAIIGVYSAVLWGKYYTKQNEFVVAASNLGRNEMEEIKAFGIYNADTGTFIPPANVVPVIHSRLQSSVDSTFDTETKKYALPSYPNITFFETRVYLHGTPTTDPKFANPIVFYQTQMAVGGI